MADSWFALSNQNIVEQLTENEKNKNTLKATQNWLNVWQTWATERKLNPKLEEYEHKQLDKMLQIFYTEIRTKDGFEYEMSYCLLKQHLSRRPQELRGKGPFYRAIIENPKTNVWWQTGARQHR